MHFLATFFVSCLAVFLFPSVGAIHRGQSLAKRANHNISPARSSVLAKRQYHARRDLIDLCVSLDATILSTLLHLVDPLHADVHLCLCLQDLDIFLDTDVDALLIANIIGKEKLRALLKIILNTSSHAQPCSLPPHAHRACVTGDPCAFVCDPHYIKVGKTCVCPRPLSECNGHCGEFPHGCPSVTPHHARAPNRVLGPVTTLAQARATCKVKETVCGIAGREGTLDYECVDTESTLDSCGGCIVQHPFMDTIHSPAEGQDCGHLPGVLTAECSNSSCIINQCQSGRTLSPNKTECIVVLMKEPRNARMRKERRRNDVLDLNATVVLDSVLRVQLKALVFLVVDLVANLASVPYPVLEHTPGSPSPPNYVEQVDAIAHVTANVLGSPTASSLVTNIDNLVHLTTLLDKQLAGCGCARGPGMQGLLSVLGKVIETVIAIQRWISSHPVGTPSRPSRSHPSSALSPSPNDLVDGVIIGLGDIFNELGTGVDILVGGLGYRNNRLVNEKLNELDPTNARSRRDGPGATALVDVALLEQITAIVNLALTLKHNSAALPVPSTSVVPGADPMILPIDGGLVDTILQAVASLLISTRVSVLLGEIDALAKVSALIVSTLEGCGCVDNLGLESVVTDISNILSAVLGLKSWCSDHPIIVPLPGQTPGSPSTPSNPSTPGNTPSNDPNSILELPINLGLGGLLAPLGVNLDADVALQGLVKVLVTAIIKLQEDSGPLPAPSPTPPPHSPSPLPHGTLIPLDKNIVGVIVKLSGKLLLSETFDDLLATTDALLDTVAALGAALHRCECVVHLGLEGLVKDVEVITNYLLAIKRCSRNNPIQGPVQHNHGSGHGPGSGYIIIDAEKLLSSLGLDGLLKVNGVLDLGGGLASLTKPLNGLLNHLGLGGVRRWLGQ